MNRAPSSTSIAELAGVGFAYATRRGLPRPVLEEVDLVVRPGEIVSLLGANGSGKTTLLRLLAGTLRPDRGWVTLFGRPARAWSRVELARRLAVLPQSLELPAGFTVGEIVAMGRAPHARSLFSATPEDEAAVEAALRDADALDLAGRFVEELSGGERQRALVAMALAQEPRLLLLDEPTLHLDLAHQVALLGTLRRLRDQRGIAVVAVLHDLNLAAAVAPRAVVLHRGRVAADGSSREVLTPALLDRVFGVGVDLLPDAAGQPRFAVRV